MSEIKEDIEEENEEEEEEPLEMQKESEEILKIEIHSDEEAKEEQVAPGAEAGEKSEVKQDKDVMSDFTLVDSVDLEVTSAVAPQSSASFVSVHKSDL